MTLRIVRKPETVQVILAAFDTIAAAAPDRLRRHRRRPASRRDGDHGPPLDTRRRSRRPPELPSLRSPPAHRTRRPQGRSRPPDGRRHRALHKTTEHGRHASPSTTPTAPSSGKAAKPPSPPPAVSRSHYIVQDGVIPRTALPAVLEKIGEMAAAENLRVTNVFHAGDGNLHPIVLYRRRQPRRRRTRHQPLHAHPRASASTPAAPSPASTASAAKSSAACPTCTPTPDLETMQRVRHAFDPHNIANPEKLFPTPRLCGERSRGPYVPHPSKPAASRRSSDARGAQHRNAPARRHHRPLARKHHKSPPSFAPPTATHSPSSPPAAAPS